MSTSQFETLRDRVRQFPENELFRFSLGKSLFDAGEYPEAIQHLEIALKHKPDWMLVAILIGRAWKELGDLAKARLYLEMGQKLAREQNHEGPLEETTQLLQNL